MTTQLTHGRGWLNADPAASLHRMDAARGAAIPLTSAGRTRAEQQALWDRWQTGGTYNRPPYLYQPAAPGTSPHEAGNAIDIGDNTARAWVIAHGGAHGWRQNIKNDLVHFIYEPARDQHAAPTGTRWDQIRLNVWRRHWGLPTIAEDGIRGPITIAAIRDAQTRFGITVDGIAGPQTDARLAQDPPAPAPTPEPPVIVEPTPEPTPEPAPAPEPPEENPMPDTPTRPAGITDEQLAAILATVEKAGIQPPDEPIIPDHIAKPTWVILALLSITVPFVVGLTVIDWEGWGPQVANQVSSATVGWLGLVAAALGLSRYAKTKKP